MISRPMEKNLFRLAVQPQGRFPSAPGFVRTLQQLFTQLVFEAFQLRTHGRGRQPQFLAAFRDATRADDRPKVKEMMVVQPFHSGIILRESLIVSSESF